jgi:hypothetical protein
MRDTSESLLDETAPERENPEAAKRFAGMGWLRNGNAPGNPNNAPRCLAKTRRGTPCQRPACVNQQTGKRLRCNLHGGRSTGPRTPEGRERCRLAGFRHGRRSQAYEAARREERALLRRVEAECKVLERQLARQERLQRQAERSQPAR